VIDMRVIADPGEMRALAEDRRRDGRRLALVPTMGYLHEGHLSLLHEGRARADLLFASIFVNPTQFGAGEDLDRYPRDREGDLEKARGCGVDVVFCPDVEAMYPPGHQSVVAVRELSRPLCGERRPGHFDGVATVVTKLFNICRPHVAVFGEKDYQQLALIRRLVIDLDLDVEIVGMPIVREPDGVALSSRNQYLGAEERAQATALHRGIEAARELAKGGERSAATLLTAARSIIESASLARVDYVELRDAATLAPIDRLEAPAVLAVAVFFGATRLIDNAVLPTE
jgi:pantoate--beta-alanine ligase